MLPYTTVMEAETAMGRSLTVAESLWHSYTAAKSDYYLYCHNIIFLFVIFSIFPVYYLFLEYFFKNTIEPFKIQPKVMISLSDSLNCYKTVMFMFFLVVGPLQLVSYPTIKMIGIRTSLPLPSLWEIAVQLVVYFIVEDYTNYWVHRLLHSKWGYDKIHKVHHEYTAPIGFAAPYAHWAEILILGIPSFLGPAMVPGHIITFWLWIALRQIEAIETHSGLNCSNFLSKNTSTFCPDSKPRHMFCQICSYITGVVWLASTSSWYDFPWTPTKYIPFYGGADYHDYHHYVGGQSQSNFASVFTYCDYIYGTDKGYRCQQKVLQQLREGLKSNNEKNRNLQDQLSHACKLD